MSKKILCLVLIGMLLFTLVGCGGGSNQSQSGESADEGPQGEPIKIGYIGALTGETALWGQAGLNGMLFSRTGY